MSKRHKDCSRPLPQSLIKQLAVLRSFRLLHSFAVIILMFTQAQAQPGSPLRLLAMATTSTPTDAPTRPKMMTLTGHIETTTGVLPGAVIAVQSNQRLRTVTDADGFFRLTLPATAEPVAVTVSYAGYGDLAANLIPGATPATLRLAPSHDIKLPRKQQLKTCLRVAHRQIERELRQVRL